MLPPDVGSEGFSFGKLFDNVKNAFYSPKDKVSTSFEKAKLESDSISRGTIRATRTSDKEESQISKIIDTIKELVSFKTKQEKQFDFCVKIHKKINAKSTDNTAQLDDLNLWNEKVVAARNWLKKLDKSNPDFILVSDFLQKALDSYQSKLLVGAKQVSVSITGHQEFKPENHPFETLEKFDTYLDFPIKEALHKKNVDKFRELLKLTSDASILQQGAANSFLKIVQRDPKELLMGALLERASHCFEGDKIQAALHYQNADMFQLLDQAQVQEAIKDPAYLKKLLDQMMTFESHEVMEQILQRATPALAESYQQELVERFFASAKRAADHVHDSIIDAHCRERAVVELKESPLQGEERERAILQKTAAIKLEFGETIKNEEMKKQEEALAELHKAFSDIMPKSKEEREKVVANLLQGVAAKGKLEQLTYANRLLSALIRTDELPPLLRKEMKHVSLIFTEQNQQVWRALGQSQAPWEAARTPSEVMVDLMATLREMRQENPENAFIQQAVNEVRSRFLQHNITPDEIKVFLKKIENEAINNDLPMLAAACKTLQAQTPASDLSLTRYHDNLYGRVYDSALVEALVKNPPPGVARSMTAMSKSAAEHLRANLIDDEMKFEFARGIQSNIQEDPRFWFPKTPMITRIKDAKTDEEVFKALMDYLDAEKTDGFDCISVPYMMVKLSLSPMTMPWMREANVNYGNITSQTSRTFPKMKGKDVTTKTPSQGGGITLRHQPSVIQDPDFVPSVRPSTAKVPDLSKLSESAKTAFSHGLPWGVGVSGSTNIGLYALKYFRDAGKPIDPGDYLLGTMMFLTYDGGHSLYESMWTANQIQKQGGVDLNLPLSDEADPNKFVADYERLRGVFVGKETESGLNAAMKAAEERMLDYFEENSFYAKKAPEKKVA